jgi:hypothetical protein
MVPDGPEGPCYGSGNRFASAAPDGSEDPLLQTVILGPAFRARAPEARDTPPAPSHPRQRVELELAGAVPELVERHVELVQ